MRLTLRQYKIILAWGLLLGFIGITFSFLLPAQYASKSVIVVRARNESGEQLSSGDASIFRAGQTIIAAMKTDDFYHRVGGKSSPYNLKKYFRLEDNKRRKLWEKNVTGKMLPNTNLLLVKVYSNSKEESLAHGKAVTEALILHGREYLNEGVSLKVVEQPSVGKWRARPSPYRAVAAGFILGAVISLLWFRSQGKN